MSSFHFLNTVQPPQVTSLKLPPNVACVLYKKETIKVEPTELPILQPDGVMVKIMASGICGSDMHGFLAGGVGGRPVTKPTVMGHESAGQVIAVGDLVTTHKVGDRVAIEPGLPCRRCVNCKSGRSNICIDMRYCGAPGSVGSLSKYYALPADMAPHIPDSIPWEVAGGIQPLAIGCQVAIRADIRAHQTIAICGVGPIGLITAAVSHAYGARKIMGFDINPARVEFAKKYISPITGRPIFDHVFLNTEIPTTLPKASKHQANGHAHSHDELAHKIGEQGSGAGVGDADVVDPTEDHGMIEGDIRWEHAKDRAAGWIEECGLTAEEGFDRAIEATGSDDCGLLAVALAKQGGVCLAIGLGHINTKTMPMIAVTNKELDVRGITRYTAPCFPRAIDLLARNLVDIKQLITAKFPLTRSLDALNAVRAGQDIKVLIMNQEE